MTRYPHRAFLLGFPVPESKIALLKEYDSVPAMQTVNFSWSLHRVLSQLGVPVENVLTVPVRDWPLSPKLVVRGERFADGSMRPISYLNVVVLKHLTRFISMAFALRDLRRGDVLLVHGLNAAMLLVAALVRQRGVVTGLAVTDEQGIALPSDGVFRRLLKRIDASLAISLSKRFDFGIALSEALADRYLGGERIVVPGIYASERSVEGQSDPELELVIDRNRPRAQTFSVGYFGSLGAAYGVRALLQAVGKLPPSTSVAFYGAGPLDQEIAEAAESDPRVRWGGFLQRHEMRDAMASVDALINPRPADTREATLSFPSKLIEYAAANRPVITAAMPAMPNAMRAAAVLIEESTPAGIAEAITRASKLGSRSRLDLAENFRHAVIAQCAPKAIAERLEIALERIRQKGALHG